MKKAFYTSLLVALFFVSGLSLLQAQNKFGHINSQKILTVMPERATAKTTLETLAGNLQDQLEIMQVEYNTKLQEYMAKTSDTANVAPAIIQILEEELTEMQQRIQKFQTSAQQELQTKESTLLQPIYEKFQAAVKEVATEGNFLYIFDETTLLYFSEKSVDISESVKKKLGITE